MTLLATQRALRDWLVREDAAAATQFGDRAAPGLSVYLNNYRSQLIDCLSAAFPCTRAWIGEETFAAHAARHIDRVPPGSWTLDAYPRDFPASLAIDYPHDPEIGELAWLEHALAEAFVAADADVLTPADIATIDWDRHILRFTPSLDHAPLTTNTPAIWSALSAHIAPPPFEYLPHPGALLVWRQGDVSQFRATDPVELQALLHARSGMPFAALCEMMVTAWGEDEGVALAGALLGRWVADGLILTTG